MKKILGGNEVIYTVSDFFINVTLNNFLGKDPSSNFSISIDFLFFPLKKNVQ